MNSRRNRVIIWVLALIPVVVTALLYGRLPAQIPTNWGLDGTVAYQGKATIWMLTGMSPLFAAMLLILPKIDPKRKNYQRFAKYYDGVTIALMLFLLVMDGVILSESLYPGRISVSKIVIIAVGALFVLLGNMMPKVKHNFFMGIRTPWTLSNEDIWNRTHRLGGPLMVLAGGLTVVSSFFFSDGVTFWVLMGSAAAFAVIPAVMSYVWYRQLPEEEPPADGIGENHKG